jgi:hypothetical protein
MTNREKALKSLFENPSEAMKLSTDLINKIGSDLGLDISNLEKREKICLISWDLNCLPTKKYEIDFGTHLRCGIEVTNNEINILGAIDGWGEGVSEDVITIMRIDDCCADSPPIFRKDDRLKAMDIYLDEFAKFFNSKMEEFSVHCGVSEDLLNEFKKSRL